MGKRTTIGIDLAKNVFAVVVLNPEGKELQRKTLRRARVLTFLANYAEADVAMEACGGAHYWAREIRALGHWVTLLPAQHVKGYQRGQKNDYNDARAIAEACYHGAIRPVAVKSLDQQDHQALLTIRRSLNKERVQLGNQLRGLLGEYGVVVSAGPARLRQQLPALLDPQADNGLTPRLRELLWRQYERLLALEQELAWYDRQLQHQAQSDDVCRRLQQLPGVGAVNACALKSWMGDGKQFARGRDASAALGLVPCQHSSGGKQRLGGITKRGDGSIRSLLVHGARAVVSRVDGKNDALSRWLQRLKAERGFNKAVVALANKLVRMAWVIVARGEDYQPA